MNDDFGLGPRRPRRGSTTTVVILAVTVIVVVLAVISPSDDDDDDISWRGGGWNLHRRMPLPGLLPTNTPASSPAGRAEGAAAPPSGGVPARPADAFALTVTHVHDGDTIDAHVDQPNDVVTTTAPIRIRLIGVDTPEATPTPECWADEARAHLMELLPEGSTLWAAADVDTWDDYGRRLFHLWTGDGRFVNHELVAAGDAEAIRIWPNVAFFELLAATQAEAEASGAGQWGACR